MMIRVTAKQIDAAAMAIHAFRVKSSNDPDPAHRHPMTYRDYKWNDLPVSEKVYYCDMAITAFTTIGMDCTDAPNYDRQGQLVA